MGSPCHNNEFIKHIVISGHEIAKVCNTKFLGIVLDDRLNWKSHIQYLKIKLAKQLVSWRNWDLISAYPLWWVCIILLFIRTWCILCMFGVKQMLQT